MKLAVILYQLQRLPPFHQMDLATVQKYQSLEKEKIEKMERLFELMKMNGDVPV